MFKEKISKYDLPDAEADIDNMFIAVVATITQKSSKLVP